MYPVHTEFINEFIQCKNFLGGSIIPSQHGQHIDECFGQKTFFFKTFGKVVGFWVGPVHGKYRKTVFCTIPFTEFTIWP